MDTDEKRLVVHLKSGKQCVIDVDRAVTTDLLIDLLEADTSAIGIQDSEDNFTVIVIKSEIEAMLLRPRPEPEPESNDSY